ncbi:MAG: hypothetical protein ABL967_19625 [Bryobacteraceae bacterium]
MARSYSLEEIQRLFQKIAGGGLWVAHGQRAAPYVGPVFAVYARNSDLFPDNAEDTYWRRLQELPVVNTIGVLALINNILAITPSDRSAQEILNQQFLDPGLAERVIRNAPEAPAFPVVFHRLGNLLAIHDLLVYGGNRASVTEAPITQIGWLALSANDYVERDPLLTPNPTNLQLTAQFIRTWDVYNPRELAYAMTRMYTILTEILPGDDPTVVTLRDRIGMDNLAVDGLTLPEFVAIAFALFAHGNAVGKEGMNRVVLDAASFFRDFPRAQPLLDTFLRGRALTIEQMAVKLAAGRPSTYERFLADAKSKTVLDAALPVFRQHPLLRIDDARVIILDLQFLTDLVTTGIYWLIFDALSGRRRETFRELWGRCFELYVTGLLRHFYPAGSRILSADIEFSGGQIDALLDFGNDVFVLEIKSSLLTEAAKRGGDLQTLAADIERKFIRNERGAPKAVLQLARAAEAVLRGELRTAIPPRRIYPVLITDEPGSECLGFNAYLNERFVKEIDSTRVRPLTVMSINECEELLPHSAANAFSWTELCETRFDGAEVAIWSVHQTIYDLRHARHVAVHRNDFILKRFEAIYQAMLRTYGVDQSVPGSSPST